MRPLPLLRRSLSPSQRNVQSGGCRLSATSLRPLIMLLSEWQMSDYTGAALMIDAFPNAAALLGDKGYDADWFRTVLADRGIAACIPCKANRNVSIPHDTVLHRRRHKIENLFGRLKDWRRIHTRYDRPHLHVRDLYRRRRNLLALISPEASFTSAASSRISARPDRAGPRHDRAPCTSPSAARIGLDRRGSRREW